MIISEIEIFSALILSTIRLVGMITFLEYYSRNKLKRFLLLSLGWFLTSLSPLLRLLSDFYNQNDSLYVFINIITELTVIYGIICFLAVLQRYITPISIRNYLLAGIGIFFLSVISLISVNSTIVSIFLNLEILGVVMFILCYLYYKRQRYLQIISRSIVYLLLDGINIFLYLLIHILNIDLNYVNNLIEIIISLASILVFIQIEHDFLLRERNILKDAYSHQLSQEIQVILGYSSYIDQLSKDSTKIHEINKKITDSCAKANTLVQNVRKIE